MPDFTDLVPIPPGINPGLNGVSNRLALSVLGNPRSTYTSNCQDITNPALAPRMVTDSVGPFRVRGLEKAVESLKLVMNDIKLKQPAVYAVLGSAGMLCCRLVRGSNHSISNHSWGLALDLNIKGILDQRGDGKVQFGLTLIAPIFNSYNWFWGAGFPTEDGMHFEVSEQLLLSWNPSAVPSGLAVGGAAISDVLTLGDRSQKVAELQRKLKALGENLDADGIFGSDTHAAVLAFQASHGLSVDGMVGPKTWAIL
ncbi:peptidoglycan-binding protein [Methylocapsa sp. D3K7]|uniref:peptidoglycan-binding protein n=1 Tax=Methylocapsa sp. D3K7 TaxID=3041435 RepID=UPI00244E9A79|nr:peptidoglycan-binding protein [Methylocapsa sp. D3K7]WGJ16082.1 peptidoglycan-binding protein [Methylocapsa sp. D3K7]